MFTVCITALSCTDKTQESKKEVIEKPATTSVKVESNKPVSVNVDSKGVEVKTKKANVSIKK